MGNDIKPVGGGIWNWIKGGIFAVAKSAAASETWKLIAPLVLAMIGAGATTLVGMAQQAPGLAIAVCAAIVFALVAFGATKVQALLASRSQAAPAEETEADRLYRIKRAELEAEDRIRRERAARRIFGLDIGATFADVMEEQEKDKKAEAEARRLRMIREASLPPPPPPAPQQDAPPSVRPRIGRAADPDTDLLIQEMRRAERLAARNAPTKPQWIPFHQALHYVVYDSRWSAHQPAAANEAEFNRIVCAEVQERLARGEIASRGRRGWGPEARKRATEEISKEFWVDAFFLPWGSIAQGSRSEDAAGKQGGGGEQWSGIIVDDVAVRKVWPRRTFPPGVSKGPTPLSAMIEDLRARCAEGNAELERQKIEPAPRQSGADLSHIGKAILDRYDGEAEVFPYRKAVLQLSEVKATAMQRGGEKQLSRIDCHMDIENHTKQQFRKCRVRLAAINGEQLEADTFLRIGRLKGEDTETEFAARPGHSKSRINFMKRDLDDVVSNPPFLLCLNDRDLPLSDGKEYKFVFALECEYEHPTYATVRFFVPEREKVEIELLSQSLDMPDE